MKTRSTNHPPTQEKCKICKTISVNKAKDKAIECDICLEWVCLKCSELPEQMYKLSQDHNSNLDFICKPCKAELPHIREIMVLKQKQLKLITDLETEREVNKKFREDQTTTNEDLNQRLRKIEQVIQEKQLDNKEYPPLSIMTAEQEKLNKIFNKQNRIDQDVQLQKSEKEEEKRREVRENNLIVYGIPEESEDVTELMKEDFLAVKEVYRDREDLMSQHITQITRLGQKKEEQIRPIRLTFSSEEKRTEVLRKNKNLKIYHTNFEECAATFCNDPDKRHKHIYISPDKTKLQREKEKKLRETLKQRRTAGEENLIIRNEKIIQKPQATQARWRDVVNDGF